LLAMDVNDDAFSLKKRGAFKFFAGKPAPTKSRIVRSMTVQLFPGARFRA